MKDEAVYQPPYSGEDTYYLYRIMLRAMMRCNYTYEHGKAKAYVVARKTLSLATCRTRDLLVANWLSHFTSPPFSMPLPAARPLAVSAAATRLGTIIIAVERDAWRLERAKALLGRN